MERIVAHSRKYKISKSIKVHLVDRTSEAPDQYNIHQPDYLLLNIVCGQVSVFPDNASVHSCPPTKGPSLFEWVRERKLRLADDGFTVGKNGREIEYDDFLPRRILGEYLAWYRELIKSQTASSIEIIEHKAKAMDLRAINDRFVVDLNNGVSLDTDYLFLAVGHITDPNQLYHEDITAQYIGKPYPLPEQIEAVKPDETIAIAGLGLSAVDSILALTIGRGGKMQIYDGEVQYVPSGKEPKIIAFSHSGLPYRSRPALGAPLAYEPIAFTRNGVDALRKEQGTQLDYDRDILPLIFLEMRIAYRRAQYGIDFGWEKANILLENLRDAFNNGNLESELDKLDSVDSVVFDPKLAYFESPFMHDSFYPNALLNSEGYEQWFQRFLTKDLNEARVGTMHSSFKTALEACREFRDIIRYAVEFDGLTEESTERFFSIHAQTLNRIGVGPQKERTADILALIKSKILHVPLGPAPTILWDSSIGKWKLKSSMLEEKQEIYADWLYRGSISHFKNLVDDPTIVGAMARRGFLRQHYPESNVIKAVDIDRNYHPISSSGTANEHIWIMGLLCEGVTFYNGYVTSPRKFVRAHYDADNAVAKIFSLLQDNTV
ncbi:MAG: FAD/NAD(P)-binding protein [Sphingobacteriales bacterium JAD_PAG50586_3]|nr:MAG: FAD/NAD(P)-binding protein [Sphingobacteriales bacterium JAD_PAG50586_3]